jgi:diaminopimelate decarboxylase
MSENPAVRRLADWEAERLRDLADGFETPLYVQDLGRVRENAARLRGAFPGADVAYAVKANTTHAVLSTLERAGVDAECASAGEVRRALEAGFPAERVRYTAVNPPARDLEYVCGLDADLTVTVGAADTLDRIGERGFDGRLCVRVNPGVGAGHHEKVSTGAEPKFGVPYDRAAELCRTAADRGFTFVGVHAHAGSGISGDDLAAHRELVGRMGELTRELELDGLDPEFVAVGGGFGVPYRPEEPPLELDRVASATREALGSTRARLAIEPGRYFVADAGVLLTTVNTVKPTPATTVVGVDAGMTTLLRPAMYDAYHEVRSLEPDDPPRGSVECEIAGPICETADVLGRNRRLPAPTRGDLLAVGNAGAYGYEMASTYNSRPRPAVVSVDGTDVHLSVEREGLTDLTALERPAERTGSDAGTDASGR